jgi:hypothetical protein
VTTLNVIGTITTTNIVAAGFTSNATNTNFNFDTLTIPFIYSTTLNVATNANLNTLIVPGTANVVTLNVSSVGTVSTLKAPLVNATTINTTSIFGTSGFVGIGTTNPTSTLHVAGNVFASNALTTPNVFASNTLQVGSGTIGSNVALFSNIGGGSNFVVINSNAWVGIGTANPQASLDIAPYAYAGGTISKITSTGSSLQIDAGTNAIYFSVGNGYKAYINGSVFQPNGDSQLTLGASLSRWSSAYIASGIRVGPTSTTLGSNIALFSNVSGGSNIVVINSNAWVGIGTTNPTSPLTVTGNASFATDTLTVPFATVGTLQSLSGVTIGPVTTTLGSNLLVISNVSGGSNVTVMTGNAMGISNVAPATTLSVGGTISALGNATTYGTVAPVTWRQGTQSSTDWSLGTGTLANYSLATSRVQMQCGSNTMTSTTQAITFPSPYINNPIVMVTPYASPTTPLYVSAISTSTFTVATTGSGVAFEWISIGI